MSKALVFSIEEFSLFDGDGIRTTVFLKGCPLRCEWCHNPEGQTLLNEVLRSPNGCRGCGECEKHAEASPTGLIYTQKSIERCPEGLLRRCAVEYTPDKLVEKLSKNLDVLNAAGGGVTFSGGEPTLNADFLLECLTLLCGKTHRAVQTCGYCSSEIFDNIIANAELILFDIKLVSSELHKHYTGVDNEIILENFRTLAKSKTPFLVRIPLIPTVTDTEENITAIAKLLRECGVSYAELLPYNKAAGAKYALVSRKYTTTFDTFIPVNARKDIFSKYGIITRIL